MMKGDRLYILLFLLACSVPAGSAALPFNDDMVQTRKLRTGSVVRGRIEGTVPVGALKNYAAKKEDTAEWKNPLAGDRRAELRGKRLFEVNCSPCHGTFGPKGHIPGAFAGKMIMQGPDLSQDFYRQKSDGVIYGTVHFGGLALMQPVGWKLSPRETWEIVSYLRSVQNSK